MKQHNTHGTYNIAFNLSGNHIYYSLQGTPNKLAGNLLSTYSNMSSEGHNKPKVDKFAALAAAQQQKAADPTILDTNSPDEGGTKDVDMLLENETTPDAMEIVTESSIQEQSSERTTAGSQQQKVQHPFRRDKFASMAAAAAETTMSSSTADGDGNEDNRTVIPRTKGNDKFAAVLIQKQVEDQNQQRQRLMELCAQRDSIWNDCDMAEDAVTDLLKYAEQTAILLSKNTTVNSTDSDAIKKSKEQLSKLIHDYQSSVVQVHDLLAKHSHHVQAYKSNVQRHGELMHRGSSTTSNNNTVQSNNNMYTQRVEHRLAETKRQLIQDLLSSMKEETSVPHSSMSQAT